MSTNKRIEHLTDYTSVLPYASEMFGVYQPMIGWKSKRITQRLQQGIIDSQNSLLQSFAKNYKGFSETHIDPPCAATIDKIEVGKLRSVELYGNNDSILLQSIINVLPKNTVPSESDWNRVIHQTFIEKLLTNTVAPQYKTMWETQCLEIRDRLDVPLGNAEIETKRKDLAVNMQRMINEESAIAGALLGMIDNKMFSTLVDIFYKKPDVDLEASNKQIADLLNADDPFVTFDPKKDISSVSLSPLGIVHLFRQFFFELDTFLGTPTGHVWLSPGSSVELIEVSTRRTYTEKTTEISTENTTKSESSATNEEELSSAVKEDNKKDLKLGATATVNQSWGTGNATATASLNMETTQQTAREITHKTKHEQTEKLSREIKENFKSTFKTITEITDTSSKRYVLNNTTPDLINYELRRKMRQVAVQVQDIGTYLCWETFVDEPGKQLGLANLVNIAQPVDLQTPPDITEIPIPEDKSIDFSANGVWNYGENNKDPNDPPNDPIDRLVWLTEGGVVDTPPAPDGFMVKIPADGLIEIVQAIGTGTDYDNSWQFKGKLDPDGSHIHIGVYVLNINLNWKNRVGFEFKGTVRYTASVEKRKEIAAANTKRVDAGIALNTLEFNRKTKDAFYKTAKERIELASKISARNYEDLREEERIIVYRNLISDLLSVTVYNDISDTIDNNHNRHTLSELLNSIFDIDKMLYFVAPEWWKPRQHEHQFFGSPPSDATPNKSPVLAVNKSRVVSNNAVLNNTPRTILGNDNIVTWSDLEDRKDNYYITENSAYAKMGSSLGWLLQLDGDDMRNAFLNAPWVKAVIPIRPGKELEATNWLQQMNVEGSKGLGDLYQGTPQELSDIKAALGIDSVTIGDALKYLCAKVAQKYKESLVVKKYKDGKEVNAASVSINDDSIVSATPIDKVYEHGFYPLRGGFKAIPDPKEPFDIISQWIEVLPTDQVVPVEVKYEAKTGRQI